MTKRLLLLTVLLVSFFLDSLAVLKERDLEQTLSVLRSELTERHRELTLSVGERRQ
jgi:hypothetical protein